MAHLSATEIIDLLGLQPHPEGGHFVESWRDPARVGVGEPGRSAGTAIYFLLAEGEESAWHRVTDAAEIWHWYAGDALTLKIAEPDGPAAEHRLGPDLTGGERPQLVVPANYWQSARSVGAWTLVGCTVSPGFEFSGFEMAPTGWQPGGA